MSEDFHGKVRANIVEAREVLVPHSIGVGVLHRETEVGPILSLHIVGRLTDGGGPAEVMVALDRDRAVGLIIQVRDMLLEAGVSPGHIIKLMQDAYVRLEAFKDLDRAPREPVMDFVCQPCRDGKHCDRDTSDTWCDCQHRSHRVDPDQAGGPVVPVDGEH